MQRFRSTDATRRGFLPFKERTGDACACRSSVHKIKSRNDRERDNQSSGTRSGNNGLPHSPLNDPQRATYQLLESLTSSLVYNRGRLLAPRLLAPCTEYVVFRAARNNYSDNIYGEKLALVPLLVSVNQRGPRASLGEGETHTLRHNNHPLSVRTITSPPRGPTTVQKFTQSRYNKAQGH